MKPFFSKTKKNFTHLKRGIIKNFGFCEDQKNQKVVAIFRLTPGKNNLEAMSDLLQKNIPSKYTKKGFTNIGIKVSSFSIDKQHGGKLYVDVKQGGHLYMSLMSLNLKNNQYEIHDGVSFVAGKSMILNKKTPHLEYRGEEDGELILKEQNFVSHGKFETTEEIKEQYIDIQEKNYKPALEKFGQVYFVICIPNEITNLNSEIIKERIEKFKESNELKDLSQKWANLNERTSQKKYMRQKNNCCHSVEYMCFCKSERHTDSVQRYFMTIVGNLLKEGGDQKIVDDFMILSNKMGLTATPLEVFKNKEAMYHEDFGDKKDLTEEVLINTDKKFIK